LPSLILIWEHAAAEVDVHNALVLNTQVSESAFPFTSNYELNFKVHLPVQLLLQFVEHLQQSYLYVLKKSWQVLICAANESLMLFLSDSSAALSAGSYSTVSNFSVEGDGDLFLLSL